METVATIGDTAGGILTGRPTSVFVDGRGRYWIGVLDAFPMIYDPATDELRQFGQPGGGPGEFRYPVVHAELPGDSMLLTDIPHFHVIAPDLTVSRSVLNPYRIERVAVMEWPDRVLGMSNPFDRSSRTTRTVIAIYDMSADSVVVVDTLIATTPSGGVEVVDAYRIFGRQAPGRDLWISDYNSYRLVQYAPSGEPQDSIVRRPEWFPGGEPVSMGGPGRPTSPRMIGHWVDAEGRLWTLAAQPRLDTGDAWDDFAQPGGGVTEVRVSSMPPAYELNRTLIEVIDPDANRVIARHTFDGYIVSVLPDNRVAWYVETPLGIPILTIQKLTLRVP